MAINDIINESWQGHSHGEVEQALKDKIQELTERLDNLSPDDTIGYNQLSSEVKQLLTRAQNALLTTDIAGWAKAANKPSYNANEIGGVEGFANLLAKLQAMDTAIAAAGGGLTEDDIDVSTQEDGVVVMTFGTETYTINLNHTHPQYVVIAELDDYILAGTNVTITKNAQTGALTINASGGGGGGGGISGITMNGNAVTINNGVADLGTVLTPQSLTGRVQSTDVSQIVVLADEAAYTALATKDSNTLYLIPES